MPGNRRLFARRMPGSIGSRVYRRAVGLVDRGGAGLPELISIPAGGMNFPIIWSIIGAALFVALINLVSRGGPGSYRTGALGIASGSACGA
jgi:hypothetical protein